MTNKEKYKEVFGFPPDTASCPTNQCDICPGNDNFRCKSKVNFWDKEYKEPERPQGEWGNWIITKIRCPKCFEYFDPYCYSKEELNKCPYCGSTMEGGTE